MASSTTIPSTIIIAAKLTWCISIPSKFRIANVTAIVTGAAIAEIVATLNGSRSITTKITAAMAIPNSIKKCPKFISTTLGWSTIVLTCTSDGRISFTSATFCVSAFPKSTIFCPGCISTVSIITSFPATVILLFRSSYLLSILAISRKRILPPCGELYTIRFPISFSF